MSNKFNAIFVSDVHLGVKHTNIKKLNKFLKSLESPPEYIYLVGDIIDGWKLQRRWYWTADCDEFIKTILHLKRSGSKVVYVYGNHDMFLQNFRIQGGDIEVTDEAIHQTINGKKMLVIHGDKFDKVIRFNKVLTFIGDICYNITVSMNVKINQIKYYFGYKNNWSFSKFIKSSLKDVCMYISCFEEVVCKYAKEQGCDMAVCGHIHQPCVKKVKDTMYYNCGDWRENATLIVEETNGDFKLLDLEDENFNTESRLFAIKCNVQ